MMEEGTEAHMETDVSSTTEDVPETQEVTDSAGNVEMVIVVETLSEEESYSSSHSEKQFSPVDSGVNIAVTASESSNPVDKEPSKSPTKCISSGNEVSKSLSTFGTPHKLINMVGDINEAQTSSQKQNVKVQSREVADSSVKDSTPSPAKELQKPTSSKVVQKTPPKDTTTPTKVLVTPSKESIKTPQKESLKSPLKEVLRTPIKDVPKTPTKALELTPTKELIITSTEDVEMTAKDVQKTPVKEAVKSPLKEASSSVKEGKTHVKEAQRALLVDSEKSPSKENVPSEPQNTPTESQKTVKDVSQGEPSTTNPKEIVQNTDANVNGKLENGNPSESTSDTNTSTPLINVTGKDVPNNSQLEANVDATEKEHNKSISRELKSLIKSAKESKIISECTQLKSKTRKSRTGLDTSANLNSTDADKIQNRRNSDNSQNSNCSEKSDKTGKRSMRSQNPEFVNKVKQFLYNVAEGHKGSEDESESEDQHSRDKPGQSDSTSTGTPAKVKKTDHNKKTVAVKQNGLRSDPYCWRCHWTIEGINEKGHTPISCTICPRSYHYKCLTSSERNQIVEEKNWVCPECMIELQAESSETRSHALKMISLGMLCDLLNYALDRLMDLNGVEPFLQPVDRTVFPEYDKYVVNPMDLSEMRSKISSGLYGSTEGFLADAQWILHNSIIFNTLQSKLTAAARALVRSCRAEMGEIEACPQCYSAAHSRRSTWFTDVCTTPHMLLWAKLKGFPYWPAKAMSVNNWQVDVRFFGAHDRAWVPAKDCFLYSEKDPNNFRTKRQDILDSMQEAEQHIRNISRKYGKFVYPPFKTQFDPSKLAEQLKMMIPDFEGEIRTPVSKISPFMSKEKRRPNSKSSKSSINDWESENDELPNKTRKMADGAEIAQEETETNKEKSNDSMEVDSTPSKSKESRKRRRSELEEAVFTIIETSAGPDEKRRRIDDKARDNKSELSTENNKTKIKEKTKSTTQESNTTTDKDKQTKNETNSSVSNIKQKEKQRVTPIRISLGKEKRVTRRASISSDSPNKSTPNKDSEKVTPQRPRSAKSDKTPGDKTTKEDISKAEKRRNSKNNKCLLVPRTDKAAEKLSEKTDTNLSIDKLTNASKDKSKENTALNKQKESIVDKPQIEKQRTASPKIRTNSPKSVKDRLHFDDDTKLAVLARQTAKTVLSSINVGMPTISSVRSLSTTATATGTTNSKTATNARMIEVSIETSSNSSVSTPTVTDSVKNAQDAATKLRSETEPLVGKVGVRAFARMTSPDRSPEKNASVQVEIKGEPIDLDEIDRQTEKLDLMNSFRLKPVNPPANTSAALRDVRIHKVTSVTPPQPKKPTPAKPAPAKPVESRPRAKKTFPQAKKPDEGLNGKNSMVYIPIQPPTTGAPVRAPRPAAPPVTTGVRVPAPVNPPANPIVNTVTAPVMQVSSLASTTPATSTPTSSTPAIGQVHTVPLMTSVNGQWMFSFQPVMSVGALDGTSTAPPVMNGTVERPPGIVSLVTSTRPADTNAPGEPPRLQHRAPVVLMNPLDTNTPANPVPTPSTAGTLTAKINQNAVKLADFFRTVLEDTIEKVDDPSAVATALKLQMEQMRWKHQQELDELKHNTELRLSEVRSSFEKEKIRIVNEVRRSAQIELEAAVKSTKTKQWCANCSSEAQFYCCWNTSYCDYPCQRSHWAQHHAVCAQQRQKNGSAPTITVGGKVVNSRGGNVDKTVPATVAPSLTASKKDSLIVSMSEDQSGNKTMKCLGTYKPSQTVTSQMNPVILNKQLMNNEENANKKVVASSGGYLIVGASGQSNSPVVMTPNRRTHTIQQIT